MKKRSLVLVLILLMFFVTSLAFPGAEGSDDGILSNSEEEILIADNGDDNGEEALDVSVDIGDNDEGGFGNLILYAIIGAVVIVVIVAIVSMTNSNKRR